MTRGANLCAGLEPSRGTHLSRTEETIEAFSLHSTKYDLHSIDGSLQAHYSAME